MAPKKELLIATSNLGKFNEICEILEGSDYKILSLRGVNVPGNFEENGETFEENALGKADYYASKTGILTLAEDSGILVDALPGELGVKTRRWGKGENATDEEWIEYFLEVMKDVPAAKRRATFVCCAALVDLQGEHFIFEGRTDGVITQTLEAPIYKGLPLSSCFKPDGFDKVYSALTIQEKNNVSHRGKALKAFRDFFFAHEV